MKYLHIHVKGHPNGYYEESRAWDIVQSVPQSDVKFLAGSFTLSEIKELQAESKKRFSKPLRIYGQEIIKEESTING